MYVYVCTPTSALVKQTIKLLYKHIMFFGQSEAKNGQNIYYL